MLNGGFQGLLKFIFAHYSVFRNTLEPTTNSVSLIPNHSIMLKSSILFFCLFFFFKANSQSSFTPKEFLGYSIGERFTRQEKVVDYFYALEKSFSGNIMVKKYGETYEKRDLLIAYIGTAENLQKLEQIKTAHKNHDANEKIAIVWLSYNVHGNESAGTEAAMETAYRLLTDKKDLLKNTIVIIDPCLNPDGRDRYVNFYYQYGNQPADEHEYSAEHNEPWPSGRPNHYLFDLNRDWAWMTQIETQQRIIHYNDWLPHVHVDFHEQGINEPYYFPPAAEPYHQVITNWQRDFQKEIGKNHASYFDKNGWLYFSKEIFDLLYPSYGDTYPMYSGSVGMTYEQGGSGRGGLSVITQVGDTLKLSDRVLHHLTTGLSTVEMCALKSEKLIKEFQSFHKNKNYRFKTYVLSAEKELLEPMITLLTKNNIIVESAPENTNVKAYNYQSGKTENYSTKKGDVLVSVNQEKGTLATVLLEPITKLSDSLTYDITAWTLPYAFDVNAYASETKVSGIPYNSDSQLNNNANKNCYAYLCKWNSMKSVQYLAALQKKGIKVYFSEKQFKSEGVIFEPGTLILMRGENNRSDFDEIVNELANELKTTLYSVKSGFSEEGIDFGSYSVKNIPNTKIGLLLGENTSSLSVGETWYYFEQELKTSVHLLFESQLESSLKELNTLIIPEGECDLAGNELLKKWISDGGKLIVLGNAAASFSNQSDDYYGLKRIEHQDTTIAKVRFGHLERQQISGAITGAIFNCDIDNSHPLAFGIKNYHTLRLNADVYQLSSNSSFKLEKNAMSVNGFVGSQIKSKQSEALTAGVYQIGTGQVIFLVDNPLFRGFWERGKFIFSNAVFMVGR